MPPPSAPRGGAVALAGAKAWLLVTGLGLNVALPLAVGQSGFGAFKRATAFLNILSNVVVVASIQGGLARRLLRSGRRRVGRRFGRAAPARTRRRHPLARVLPRRARDDRDAARATPRPALRVLSVILFAYAIHASLVGALNGRQALRRQALLDATYGTLRPALIVGLGSRDRGAPRRVRRRRVRHPAAHVRAGAARPAGREHAVHLRRARAPRVPRRPARGAARAVAADPDRHPRARARGRSGACRRRRGALRAGAGVRARALPAAARGHVRAVPAGREGRGGGRDVRAAGRRRPRWAPHADGRRRGWS